MRPAGGLYRVLRWRLRRELRYHHPIATSRPWTRIERLDPSLVADGRIAALDELREQWERLLARAVELDRDQRRQRSLRLLAIETGILEHLYDIDWGMTLTLAAEGFSREAVARANGKVDGRTLETLRA